MLSQSRLRGQGLTTGRARHVCKAIFERRSRSLWRVSWVMVLVALTGCAAAYRPPTLTTQHPAHPEATMAPDLPPSTTLAYTPADIPSARPAVATAPRGAESVSSFQPKGAHTVIGEGKVIAVVPASREIVLTHGEIQGFMDAMTMGYAIQPAALLEGVRAGDTVRFTIDTEQKAIVTLEKLQP
jgi:Cu/Ag efflux protein CusF